MLSKNKAHEYINILKAGQIKQNIFRNGSQNDDDLCITLSSLQ